MAINFVDVLSEVQGIVQAATAPENENDLHREECKFLVFDSAGRLGTLKSKLQQSRVYYHTADCFVWDELTDEQLAGILQYRNQHFRLVMIAEAGQDLDGIQSFLDKFLKVAENNMIDKNLDTSSWVRLTLFNIFVGPGSNADIFRENAKKLSPLLDKSFNSGAGRSAYRFFPDLCVVNMKIDSYDEVLQNTLADRIFFISYRSADWLLSHVSPRRDLMGRDDSGSDLHEETEPYSLFTQEGYPWVGFGVVETNIPEKLFLELMDSSITQKLTSKTVYDRSSSTDMCSAIVRNAEEYRRLVLIILGLLPDPEDRSDPNRDREPSGQELSGSRLSEIIEDCSQYIAVEMAEPGEWAGAYKTVAREVPDESFFGRLGHKTKRVEEKVPINNPLNQDEDAVSRRYREYVLRRLPPAKFLEFLFKNLPCIYTQQMTETNANNIRQALAEVAGKIFDTSFLREPLEAVTEAYVEYISNCPEEDILEKCTRVQRALGALQTRLLNQIREYGTVGSSGEPLDPLLFDDCRVTLSTDEEDVMKRVLGYLKGKKRDADFLRRLKDSYGKSHIDLSAAEVRTDDAGTLVKADTMEIIKKAKDQNIASTNVQSIRDFRYVDKTDFKLIRITRYPCRDLDSMIENTIR